jgi:hypothetical protein
METQQRANAALKRELDLAYDELAKANVVITEQSRKLAAHDRFVDLEQKLHEARARMAS